MAHSRFRVRWQFRPAFSLLEVVAVALLIGIVSAGLVTRLNHQDHTAAKDNVVNDSLAKLQMAAERYCFDTDQFPGNLNDLVAAGYISSIPKSLHSGKQFSIQVTGIVVYE